MSKIKTGTKPTLCYIGDLPDRRVDGITLSFQYNLDLLSKYFEIISTPENSSLGSRSGVKLLNVFSFWLRSFLFVRLNNPDFVYLNLPTSTFGAFKVIVLLSVISKRKAKTVLHIHRGDLTTSISDKATYKAMFKQILNLADSIIVLSKMEENHLSKLFPKGNFYHLPNTIHAPKVSEKKTDKRLQFLFLSNYLENKGIIDLLEIFSEIDFVSLVCHGHIPNERMAHKLKKYTQKNIEIKGPVLDHEKFEVLKNAKCLVLPSWSEGQPLVILEAMSQGVPVLATDVGFIREMVGKKYPFLVPPRDKIALKNRLLKVNDHNELEETGKELRNRYLKHFSPEKHQKILIEIFKSLVN